MRFEDIKSTLVRAADEAGLSEYEIYYMQDESRSCETLGDEISSFSSKVGGGVSFRCICNGKIGYASSELFEADEMRALVKRAISNAESMQENTDAEIFVGSEHYNDPSKLCYEEKSSAELKDIALDIQKRIYDASPYVTDGTQSGVSVSKIDISLINSHGLELSNSLYASAGFAQAVVSKDGKSEDDFDFCSGLLEKDYDKIVKNAVDRALSKLDASELTSGKYDIIFSGGAMRNILSSFCAVFSGKQALNGLSLLGDKVGQKIAAECVTIVDDPAREGSTMHTHFDGEGVATCKKNVIENGVLKTLLYDIETAKKAGCSTTANGNRSSYSSTVEISPYNFYILAGDKSCEELFSKVQKGIYVTELKGLHAGANAVTGDFSIESAGYIIENGKLGKAVRSFTVAGNFYELLKNIEDISDNVDFSIPSVTAFGSPDVLVRNMSVAGK